MPNNPDENEKIKTSTDSLGPDLDSIIRKLTIRVNWYLAKLEMLEDDVYASNRTSDALNKLASLLMRLLELKGYKFDADTREQHVLDILQKLDQKTRKKVEEVIKFGRETD